MRDAPDRVNPGDRSPFRDDDAVTVRLPRWALRDLIESLDRASEQASAGVARAIDADEDALPGAEALADLSRSIRLLKLADALRRQL